MRTVLLSSVLLLATTLPQSAGGSDSPPADVAADARQTHWAFRPIRRPPVPEVRAATPVDAFLLARLKEKGLSPSPDADPRTLIRRLTFDLHGLPPTPEEVDAFVESAIRNPQSAIERLVDRLLASPRYGERWGRHWLDVARYADTKGYVFFEEAVYPWAWTYRDYVIRAFNRDLPYDRFILEQLAADRLTGGKGRSALPALGFLVLGGRFMNNVHDILDDRIDVVTRGLMGLTVSCARCHDHKFDPIPTRDYYSLYGVFASSQEPSIAPLFFDPPPTPEYEKFIAELVSREKKLSDFLEAKRHALVEGARKRAAEYLLAVHNTRDLPDMQNFMLLTDTNDLNPAMIKRWRAQLRRSARTGEPVFALWHLLSPLPEQDFAKLAKEILDTIEEKTVNPLVLKAFRASPPNDMAEVTRRYGELFDAVEEKWRQSMQPLPDAAEEQVRQALYGPEAAANVLPGTMNELDLLPDRPSQGELKKLRKEVEDWRVSGAGAPPRAYVLNDLPTPIEPRVFVRGNPGNLGEPVPRRLPELLAGTDRRPFSDGSGRLELARAIASKDNPLTARVLVNRVWMHHFGRGLVTTPGDFGMRSDPPSHPELLDWLAWRFMEDGWSIKRLHRHIVLSSAYRQQSLDRPEARRVDPENVLLWRFNRRRLDFESMRDALLATSGRLDPTIGGPSMKDLLGAESNRRTLYGHLDRLNVPGLYRTFDFPGPDATSPQRTETTVPQQALFLMNNPFVQDCARKLLERADIATVEEVPARVDRVYRLLFARPAAEDEVQLAREYLGDAPQMVSWERYVQALLLTNEFLFVD